MFASQWKEPVLKNLCLQQDEFKSTRAVENMTNQLRDGSEWRRGSSCAVKLQNFISTPVLSSEIFKYFTTCCLIRGLQRYIWTHHNTSFDYSTGNAQRRLYGKPNAAHRHKHLVPTVEHGGGWMMIWLCLAATGSWHLAVILSTMSSSVYQSIQTWGHLSDS